MEQFINGHVIYKTYAGTQGRGEPGTNGGPTGDRKCNNTKGSSNKPAGKEENEESEEKSEGRR